MIFGISTETIIILAAFILLAAVLIYFYRFSNKTLMKKIKDIKRKEHELDKMIDKINKARMREQRAIKKRLDLVEEKIDYLVEEEPEQETVKETIPVIRK